MPTVLTHVLVGAAAGKTAWPGPRRWRFLTVMVVLSVLPDLDVLGLRLGIPYEAFLGHRGFLHSLPFAALASVTAALVGFRDVRPFSGRWWGLAGCFFGVMALHDLLDAMTDGGLGIALFSPFDTTRYFLPWRPIRVSPIGMRAFLSRRGLATLLSEVYWLWLPAWTVCLTAWLVRRRLARRRPPARVSP
jgi:inner membrane protein